jgi:hypothetical protein
LLGIGESQILNQTTPDAPVDIAVVLGRDWDVP